MGYNHQPDNTNNQSFEHEQQRSSKKDSSQKQQQESKVYQNHHRATITTVSRRTKKRTSRTAEQPQDSLVSVPGSQPVADHIAPGRSDLAIQVCCAAIWATTRLILISRIALHVFCSIPLISRIRRSQRTCPAKSRLALQLFVCATHA